MTSIPLPHGESQNNRKLIFSLWRSRNLVLGPTVMSCILREISIPNDMLTVCTLSHSHFSIFSPVHFVTLKEPRNLTTVWIPEVWSASSCSKSLVLWKSHLCEGYQIKWNIFPPLHLAHVHFSHVDVYCGGICLKESDFNHSRSSSDSPPPSPVCFMEGTVEG